MNSDKFAHQFSLSDEQLKFFEDHHYLIFDSVGHLGLNFLIEAQNLILSKYVNQELKKSGVGVNGHIQPDIRGDFIQWIEEDSRNSIESEIQHFLKSILDFMNHNYFLGLKKYEAHMTLYPKGSHYEKHLDVLKNKTNGLKRKLSFILYLNEGYTPDAEGELVLYDLNDQVLQKITPNFGKAVLFFSDEFPHEVLTIKNRERISITAWFLG